MRRTRRKKIRNLRDLLGFAPLGVFLVIILVAVFLVKGGYLPSGASASSNWSPRIMYEQYLGQYKAVLANRAVVAEKVQEIYNEKLSAYNEGLQTLFEEYKCCPAGTKCGLLGLSISNVCTARNGFLMAKSSYVTEINGRKITHFSPSYDLMIVNLDMWNPYTCDNVDCVKIVAQRATEEMRIKTESKYSNSPYNFWNNLLRVAKIQLPPAPMTKENAYGILSTLNPIVINSDADSVRNLQSALNAFKLPYKAEDLIPPDMDLLVKWNINSAFTSLMLEYWSGANPKGWIEWSQSSSGKSIYNFHNAYYKQQGGKTLKFIPINAVCPPLPSTQSARREQCVACFNSVISSADFRIAQDLKTT